jgi:hypothetical protein
MQFGCIDNNELIDISNQPRQGKTNRPAICKFKIECGFLTFIDISGKPANRVNPCPIIGQQWIPDPQNERSTVTLYCHKYSFQKKAAPIHQPFKKAYSHDKNMSIRENFFMTNGHPTCNRIQYGKNLRFMRFYVVQE